MLLHFIATGKFELLGILPSVILPRLIFSCFTRSSFLFPSPSDACQAGYFQDGRTFVSKLPTFKTLFAFVVLTLFKTSRSRGQHLCSKFAKIPHLGCPRMFKVPTSSHGPPLGHNIDSCISESLDFHNLLSGII